MKKILLLDANALIFRAYYAFIKNPRVNSKGQNTSAIFGFVNTLEELLQKIEPTHIGAAFDPSTPTFRHKLYPAYKAQREETPEDIRWARPFIKQILQAYGIPILEVDGFEADDVIGTLSKQASNLAIETMMVTPDKDYVQLVDSFAKIYRFTRQGVEIIGETEVKEKFNLSFPAQMIDLLGLMGDSADNIPGCKGVGEKTALKLLEEFESIERLLMNTDKLKGKLKEKIEAHQEDIRISKFLATINTEVPIRLDLESLARKIPNKKELLNIYKELEFKSFIRKLEQEKEVQEKIEVENCLQDLFTADSEEIQVMQNVQSVNPTYHTISTNAELQELISCLQKTEQYSFYLATAEDLFKQTILLGLSFALEAHKAYFLPFPEKEEMQKQFFEQVKQLFQQAQTTKIVFNLKQTLGVLLTFGIEVEGKLADPMLSHYLLQPETTHSLNHLTETYLNYKLCEMQKEDLTIVKTALQACEIADITYQLHQYFTKELAKEKLEDLYDKIEMPLSRVLAKMEYNGVKVDTKVLKEIEKSFTKELDSIEENIYLLAKKVFNINSPKQVGEILFEDLKITQKAKKTKSGQYITSEEVLESLKEEHPIVKEILQYRGFKKLLSTYVEALPKLVNPDTKHIHSTFNQAVTATGRLSSSNPNLQNIPIRDSKGKEIRKAFIPEDNSLFLSADYSQIELRLMAHLSNDPHMIEAFCKGEDIHANTAARIYNKPLSEITSDERRKAKTANFGIIYGISAFGLATRLGISRKEAKELIDSYFKSYPTVKEYMHMAIKKAKELGYAETLSGRKRFLPDLMSQNAVVRGYAERNAINAPIQGTAADIIKIAMVRIAKRIQDEKLNTKMILQVHDELNFSVPVEEQIYIQKIVVEEMEGAFELRVPLKVDFGWGKNWLEAH